MIRNRHKRNAKPKRTLVPCMAALALSHMAFAQSTPAPATTTTTTTTSPQADESPSAVVLEPLTVIGSAEAAWGIPGAAAYVDAAEFRERGYTDLGKALAKVPGIYIRGEDGYGNFLNISLRGVNGNRSDRVTLMEDGILTSPSVYSNPSAYYSPKVGRMAGVEVLKGSSQVRYGPNTTGGVVNFLSTPVPEGDASNFYSRTTYGSNNTFFNHSYYGDTIESSPGRFGYLFEIHAHNTDGFRDIDDSSKDSGFDLLEPMLKLFWEPNSALKQRFELKVGYTKFDMDDSYPGVTEKDLRNNYDRRYASADLETFESEHFRSYLKWIAEPSDFFRFETALYYNRFERAFYRLQSQTWPGGSGNTDVALANPAGVAVLQGRGPGTVLRLSNLREHESYGWQNQANFEFDTGALQHNLAVGLRLHYDSVTGQGQDYRYASTGLGGFTLQAKHAELADNALTETFATAIYLEDDIKIGKFSIRPGIRYEWMEYDDTTPNISASPAGPGIIGRSASQSVSRSVNENLIMGGIGLNYEINDQNAVFAGVYRGASPANPTGYMSGTESEESLSYELGFRHEQEAFRAELIGFFTEFDNLIAPQVGVTLGNVVPDQNAGQAEVWGLESVVEYDAGKAAGWSIGLPVYVSATWTNAEFTGDHILGNGAGIFAGGRSGNEIPYVPEWKLAAGIGLTGEKWAVHFDGSYISRTWGTGYNSDQRLNGAGTGPGTPTILDGEVDELLLFDLSAHYQVSKNVKLVAGIHNLFDERALISRHPAGARGNEGRSYFVGAEITF